MATKAQPPPRKKVPCDPAAFGIATNIDRRTCQRVVPMKVLALGPSRSGTASIRQALIDLGYSDCYHFAALMQENPRDVEMWNEAFRAKFEGKGKPFTREDWDQLLGHCMAVSDTPCAVFYRELLAAYPEAKVIVTVRDSPEQWWESQMRTIIPFFDALCLPAKTWRKWLWRKFLPAPGEFDVLNGYLYKYYEMYRVLVRDYLEGRKDGIAWFEEYVGEIKRIVPKERLLIMNVKEGWGPLCEFLGEERPEWEFPKVNTIHDWERNTGVMYQVINRQVYVNAARTVGSAVAGFGVVAAATWWFMRRL